MRASCQIMRNGGSVSNVSCMEDMDISRPGRCCRCGARVCLRGMGNSAVNVALATRAPSSVNPNCYSAGSLVCNYGHTVWVFDTGASGNRPSFWRPAQRQRRVLQQCQQLSGKQPTSRLLPCRPATTWSCTAPSPDHNATTTVLAVDLGHARPGPGNQANILTLVHKKQSRCTALYVWHGRGQRITCGCRAAPTPRETPGLVEQRPRQLCL